MKPLVGAARKGIISAMLTRDQGKMQCRVGSRGGEVSVNQTRTTLGAAAPAGASAEVISGEAAGHHVARNCPE